MRRAVGTVAVALSLAPFLLASSGCSLGLLHTLGDQAADQEADVVGTAHPESGPGEVSVRVSCTDEPAESRIVTLPVPVELGAWKSARVVKQVVVDKEGPLEDQRVYHQVEIERDQGWELLGEVEGFTRPSSGVKRVLVGILVPIAAAFDTALLPIYIWGAVFVKYILPDKPFG